MSIAITGGCDKCNRLCTVSADSVPDPHNVRIICPSCYEKHYSKSAIRRKRIKKLTKESLWVKLKNKLHNLIPI